MKSGPVSVGWSWLFVLLLSGVANLGWGQVKPTAPPLDPVTHRFVYKAHIPVAGGNPADLGLRALAWARKAVPVDKLPVRTRGPAGEVVQAVGVRPYADEARGKPFIIALHYAATITVQAGGYAYEVTNFVFVYPSAGQAPPARIPAEDFFNGAVIPLTEASKQQLVTQRKCFQEAAREVVADLLAGMRKPTSQPVTK